MTTVLNSVKQLIDSRSIHNDLMEKIINKTAVVGVIGMGYVGLPNMVSRANSGFRVIGFDIDSEKVELVNKGVSYIDDVPTGELRKVVKKGRIIATSDFEMLSQVDVILICVPTPIDEYKQPNLSYIKKSTIQIVKYATSGTLVILESTTYPSTTEDYLVQYAEGRGLAIGEDFFVAYSAERIDPSNKVFNVNNTPRVVGGHTVNCTNLAKVFIGGDVTEVSSTKVAEMSKVYENTFRYVNIALANELALICNKIGIDPWEVIDASKTKPFGFMPFYPTTGVGGHCIPVDPYYLSWYSKKLNYNAGMIEMAGEVNSRMNDYTVDRISQILNNLKKSVNGSNIAILGATYKRDISDIRESPIFRLHDSLQELGANIDVCDPYVKSFKNKDNSVINISDINYDRLRQYDIVVLLTDHSSFDYDRIALECKAILDTRNGFKNITVEMDNYYKI